MDTNVTKRANVIKPQEDYLQQMSTPVHDERQRVISSSTNRDVEGSRQKMRAYAEQLITRKLLHEYQSVSNNTSPIA